MENRFKPYLERRERTLLTPDLAEKFLSINYEDSINKKEVDKLKSAQL